MLHAENGEPIAKTRFAKSAFEKFRGLMLEEEKNFDYALVFELGTPTRIGASVHMMFVFFPICIAFLDGNKRVFEKNILEPWALNYTPKAEAKWLVELPIRHSKKIRVGERLFWD
ncbi:MAG: DUF192 domain-containing protein [archaeon]|nr:DUF192 domain-containing protein [archaeon]